jgi:hypothetical protein
MSAPGQAFLKECRAAGKEICVWTVNDPGEMRTAMSWGVKAVLTDRVGVYTELKKQVSLDIVSRTSLISQIVADPGQLALRGIRGSLFGWSSWRYYSIAHVGIQAFGRYWVGAHGALPSLEQLHDYLNTPPLPPPSHHPVTLDNPPATSATSPDPHVPTRRNSYVPESVLAWVETAAASDTVKKFI